MKILATLCLLAGAFVLASCDEEDTYGDMKRKERKVISSFIKRGTLQLDESGDTLLYVAPIKVISEKQFYAQDTTTNVAENEYVLFSNSGVYMQIVRRGAGRMLEHGKSAVVEARYTELNMRGDSIQTSNDNMWYIANPDELSISNSYGVFTASFRSGVMYANYGASVPPGWLIPFSYIRIGRQEDGENEIAKVRLIVPSTEGQQDASGDVYACFYEIRLQRASGYFD